MSSSTENPQGGDETGVAPQSPNSARVLMNPEATFIPPGAQKSHRLQIRRPVELLVAGEGSEPAPERLPTTTPVAEVGLNVPETQPAQRELPLPVVGKKKARPGAKQRRRLRNADAAAEKRLTPGGEQGFKEPARTSPVRVRPPVEPVPTTLPAVSVLPVDPLPKSRGRPTPPKKRPQAPVERKARRPGVVVEGKGKAPEPGQQPQRYAAGSSSSGKAAEAPPTAAKPLSTSTPNGWPRSATGWSPTGGPPLYGLSSYPGLAQGLLEPGSMDRTGTNQLRLDGSPEPTDRRHKLGSVRFVHERKIPSNVQTRLFARYPEVQWGTCKAQRKLCLHPISSLSRLVGELVAAQMLSEYRRILMPGARTSLARLLTGLGATWAGRIHVCQPNLGPKDAAAVAHYAVDGRVTACAHRLEECTCMRDAEVVYLTNVVYYLGPAAFSRYPEAKWLSFHHHYEQPEGSFPSAKDLKLIEVQTSKSREHAWTTVNGVMSVTVDDGEEYVHPNAAEVLRRLGRSAHVVWHDEWHSMRNELAWLVKGVVPSLVSTSEAATLLLSGRRTAVEAAHILARSGVPFAAAVEAVLGALPEAWNARLTLEIAQFWSERERWVPHLCVGLGIGALVWARWSVARSLVGAGKRCAGEVWRGSLSALQGIRGLIPAASSIGEHLFSVLVVSPLVEECLVRPVFGTTGVMVLEALRLVNGTLSWFGFAWLGLVHTALAREPRASRRVLYHSLYNLGSLLGTPPAANAGWWGWIMGAVASVFGTAAPPPQAKREKKTVERGIREGVAVGESVSCVCVGHYSSQTPLDVHHVEGLRIRKTKEGCPSGPSVVRTGPMVAGRPPLVFKNCAHNQVTAVCRRLIQAKTVPHLLAEMQYLEFMKVFVSRMHVRCDFLESRTSEWLKRFPVGKREDLKQEGHHKFSYQTSHAMFVKVEKQPMLDHLLEADLWVDDTPIDGEGIKLDPRAICCPPADVRYATGPVGNDITHALGNLLDGSAHAQFILYPCGYTAERLGMAFDDAVDTGTPLVMVFGDDFFAVVWVDGKLWFVWADASRQDSHMRRGIKMANAEFLFQLVARGPDGLMGWYRHHWMKTHEAIEIKTIFVSFEAEHGMSSGDSITGANATTASAVLAERLVDLAISGETKATVAGFPYELGRSQALWDADFLSMLWYPAVVGGVIVTKPGPKLGRILAKTFWHVGLLGERKCRGHAVSVAECLWLSASHIPVLNDLLQALLTLARDDRGTGIFEDPEEIHKIRGTLPYEEHPMTEEFMCGRYGFALSELNELRRQASEATFDTVFSGSLWETVVKRDCA
jgi:hypothetical protein